MLANQGSRDASDWSYLTRDLKRAGISGGQVNFYQPGDSTDPSLNATLNAYTIYQKVLDRESSNSPGSKSKFKKNRARANRRNVTSHAMTKVDDMNSIYRQRTSSQLEMATTKKSFDMSQASIRPVPHSRQNIKMYSSMGVGEGEINNDITDYAIGRNGSSNQFDSIL
jgi:hypothetical protein